MNQFERLMTVAEQGLSVTTVTLVAAPHNEAVSVGQMLILYPAGRIDGCLVDADITDQIAKMLEHRRWQEPALLDISIPNRGDYRIFWDRLTNGFEALVLGGGHISQPLVDILAVLDFKVTVVDDRPQFANAARFPRANRILCGNFSDILATGKVTISRDMMVAIVTRGHQYDLDCLRATLHGGAGYLGMIGSRRRIRGILDMLQAEGVPEEILARVRAPIGLDIGAKTPAEIAVSIAAEAVAVFRGGTGRSLSQRQEENRHG